MEIVGREIMWNLPPSTGTIMYALFGVVLLVLGFGFYARYKVYRSGREEFEDRFDDPEKRLLFVFREGILQKKTISWPFGGTMHLMIYSGFIALFIATCLVALQYDFGFQILHGRFFAFFEVFSDTFGLVLIAGIVTAAFRRYILNPPGLTREGDDLLQLLLILTIAITGFLVEGLRIAATSPEAAKFSYGGKAIAAMMKGGSNQGLLAAHRILWWIHLILAFGWIASIPYSKIIHFIAGPANMFFKSSRPKGALQPIPDMEEQERLGALKTPDLSWKSLISADACTKCGRCQDVCPAYNTEKSLSPREVVLKTKRNMTSALSISLVPARGILDKATGKPSYPPLVGEENTPDTITPQELWECTTCGACVHECPVSIEHIDMIMDMRRGLVFESKIPESARFTLSKLMNTGNPWGLPQDDRSDWMRGMDVPVAMEKKQFEYLYWIGCFGAYDMRNQKVTRAIIDILERSGTDYAILGQEEMCCGDPARRLGEEGLFQFGMIETNREVFQRYGVRKIITQCPHCFNTFKNEYPQFGVEFEEVIHHTQLIDDLIRAGRIQPRKALNNIFAIHDSCYLGRHNDIYEAPRRGIAGIPGITVNEMDKNRDKSFCCGAGGGGMWFEEEGTRISAARLEQAEETGATGICTSCPYCLTMFDDGIKTKDMEEDFVARDVAEIVSQSLD
ncbi:MAG: 4Fe-4S dicluster domain-containing protein [Deltaproteobacteria bacterium]|nr:4Fe-4S dicluster domain-containing protein [Deltaproteobacteria bacterium]NIS76409.1 4Fe-4S dicluster domain-containing protein [Deltaproteobacteria bacterium]